MEGSGGDDGTVPRSVLIREREKRGELETQLTELRAKLQQLEDGGKSEIAQAVGRAERAEAKLTELSGKLSGVEAELSTTRRSGMLRDALLALDGDKKVRGDAVGAAVRLADLTAIEDESAAKKAAAKLLEDHPFLVASAESATTRMGTSGSGRQGSSTGEEGGRAAKPMTDEQGHPTEEFKRGFGNFLLGVAGRSREQEGQPTT